MTIARHNKSSHQDKRYERLRRNTTSLIVNKGPLHRWYATTRTAG